MNFTVSHVYQESNICTDKLADSGIQSSGFRGFRLWDLFLIFLRVFFSMIDVDCLAIGFIKLFEGICTSVYL